MKHALISLLVSGASLWGGNQPPTLLPVEFNVNSRYTVEKVELSPEIESRISRGLRQDLEKLIGQQFNTAAVNDLAGASATNSTSARSRRKSCGVTPRIT